MFGLEAIGGEDVPPRNIPMRSGATPSLEISWTGAAPGGTGALDEEGEEAGFARKKRRHTGMGKLRLRRPGEMRATAVARTSSGLTAMRAGSGLAGTRASSDDVAERTSCSLGVA